MIQFKAVAKKFGKQGEKTGWTYIEIPFDIAEKKITLALATKPAGENTMQRRERRNTNTLKKSEFDMEDKILITHQMLSKNRFIPTWKVKYLFLGTFNPLGGDDVEYYYGRKKNKFWTILSTILDEKNLDRNNFENLSPIMENYCFGCIDIIKSIECPSSYKNKICGNGYSDSIVFTAKGFKRNYSFDDIEDFLRANSSVQKIFTTWGVSNYINEWKNKKLELIQICKRHNKELIDLGSPSPRAIRKLNLDGVIKNWGNKIQFNLKGCK